jgi:hypothetical protein
VELCLGRANLPDETSFPVDRDCGLNFMHNFPVHLQCHVVEESREESMKNDNEEQSCSTDMDDSVFITTTRKYPRFLS